MLKCFLQPLIDLRRREETGRLDICDTNGNKCLDIRKYMQQAVGDVYKEMDLTMDWWSVEYNRYEEAKKKNVLVIYLLTI